MSEITRVEVDLAKNVIQVHALVRAASSRQTRLPLCGTVLADPQSTIEVLLSGLYLGSH